MAKKLLLFPFGGNAREALPSLLGAAGTGEWDVIGFVDDDVSRHGMECCGIRVLGGRELLDEHPDAFVLAVPGSPQNYAVRDRIIDGLRIDRARFATVMHPSVVVAADAFIGANTLLMPNVVISCGVTIGSHCIILPNTVVSHDSTVGDCCCLGSNISVSGSVQIGKSCYIGSGTKIREHVAIGEGTLIGLGSNVIHDIEPGVVAAGCPARVLRRAVS